MTIQKTSMTRRRFGQLATAGIAALTARPAMAQAGTVSFMSFTYAEEPNKPHVQKLLDGFAAAGGKVEAIGSAWGDMQKNILLRQRSRTLPTTAQIQERWMPSLATLPDIVNLDDILGRAKLEAAIDPKILAMGRVNGKTVGLPLITGSVGMVANKEVLAKAGVEVPETLADFKKALIAIRDKVPNSVPYAPATKNVNSIPLDFMIMVWAHGGRIIDETGKVLINSDAGRATLAFMTELMKDRLIAPELDRPDSRRLFGQGACGFYADPPQARGFARAFSGRGEAADAFVLPIKTPVLKAGDTPHSIQWGHLVSAFKGPMMDGPDSPGAKWLNYLISDAAQGTFPPSLSALPVTRSAQALPVVTKDAFFSNWKVASGTPLINEIGIWSNAPELSTILSEEFQAAVLGQKPSDAAIAAMASRMEASMAKRG
ncbi:MAG: extracellular solute-binding protein [Proteobacteria bacterium]|nr:extracellular solute-binding protein [Pseudomonadota bacterium]